MIGDGRHSEMVKFFEEFEIAKLWILQLYKLIISSQALIEKFFEPQRCIFQKKQLMVCYKFLLKVI
jgi:hypothetical protein